DDGRAVRVAVRGALRGAVPIVGAGRVVLAAVVAELGAVLGAVAAEATDARHHGGAVGGADHAAPGPIRAAGPPVHAGALIAGLRARVGHGAQRLHEAVAAHVLLAARQARTVVAVVVAVVALLDVRHGAVDVPVAAHVGHAGRRVGVAADAVVEVAVVAVVAQLARLEEAVAAADPVALGAAAEAIGTVVRAGVVGRVTLLAQVDLAVAAGDELAVLAARGLHADVALLAVVGVDLAVVALRQRAVEVARRLALRGRAAVALLVRLVVPDAVAAALDLAWPERAVRAR